MEDPVLRIVRRNVVHGKTAQRAIERNYDLTEKEFLYREDLAGELHGARSEYCDSYPEFIETGVFVQETRAGILGKCLLYSWASMLGGVNIGIDFLGQRDRPYFSSYDRSVGMFSPCRHYFA